ncbi:hypothetical protein C8A01DRAFT_42182 [Parachaetomium inaequale]|uniref:Uncharacterized protein n=1 Tax=Parachaetomium inaequale TaxID=2588326 RepID=A0AAN6P5Z1_9PEZI|nr:hypothetical protein C8A01DRAFT_42182 [Parachaetomium inaequale]
MDAQLPPEAVGAAAGVLIYSFICLACGLLLLWLVSVHDERMSCKQHASWFDLRLLTTDVAMLGFFATLHTLASIAQQIHTIVRWREIKIAQYDHLVANVGNPELNQTGSSVGLDLVLFYIQYYAYNVESLLVLFWYAAGLLSTVLRLTFDPRAIELANSISQLRMTKMYRFHTTLVAKASAAILPILQLMLLHFTPIYRSSAGFMALSCGVMILCFSVGAIVLFIILARYILSRITLATWSVRYGRSSGGINGTSPDTPRLGPKRNIYDKWLVLRFSIGFAAMSLFQIVVINFQLRSAATNNAAKSRLLQTRTFGIPVLSEEDSTAMNGVNSKKLTTRLEREQAALPEREQQRVICRPSQHRLDTGKTGLAFPIAELSRKREECERLIDKAKDLDDALRKNEAES